MTARAVGLRQLAVGVAILAAAVFVFAMSSRTGERRYEEARTMLQDIGSVNTRLDASLVQLLFEFRTDVDALTAIEQELTALARDYVALEPAGGEVRELVAAKLALVEDFKSQQAVTRNSRAISAEMLAKLHRTYRAASLSDQQALLEIERSFADFSALRDSTSAAKLVETVEAATQGGFAWTTDLDWSTFAAHVGALARYREMLDTTMSAVYAVPVASVDARQQAAAAQRFARTAAVAGRFRAALLAVAVALLLFSGHMVWKVRDYLLVIQRHNEQLEQRVETRTQELSAANDALQAQIHERELIESQLRLAQKLESIGQLAAGIAHEINTPAQYVSDNVTFLSTAWRDLTKLIGEYATALLKGQPDAKRSEQVWAEVDVDYLLAEVPLALDQAGSGLKQISHIVRAMKDFSHPGAEGLQPTDLNRAIESTSTVARSEWKYVADLALELDPTLPLVPCNVSAMNQVVLNIVVNAAQAIGGALAPGERGHIWISSRSDGQFAVIVIEDDGPGVPAAVRDKVFDPFFTTKAVGNGTGQGLAIAYRIVTQQHGGRLSVGEGRGGKGARFVIELPLEQSHTSEAAEPRAA